MLCWVLKTTVWTLVVYWIFSFFPLSAQLRCTPSSSESLIYVPVMLSSEISAHLSRISHTLSVVFPGRHDELIGQSVIKLHINFFPSSELQVKVGGREIHCFQFLYSQFCCMYVSNSVLYSLKKLFFIFSGCQHGPEKLLPMHVRCFPS